MNRRKLWISSLILSFFTAFFLSHIGFAVEENPISAYLVERGISYYEKGQFQEAVHEFSKVLLVDSDHQVALKYLHNLGLTEGLYQGTMTTASTIEELSKDVKEYKFKTALLEEQKTDIEQQIRELQAQRDDLQESMKAKSLEVDQFKERLKSFQEQMEDQKRMHATEIKDLEHNLRNQQQALQGTIEQQKKQLVERVLTSKEKEEQLISLNEEVQKKIEQLLDYQAQMNTLDQKYRNLREEFFSLKSKYGTLHDVLEDYAYIHKNAMHACGDRLIIKELDAVERNEELTQNLNELSNLKETLKKCP